jgi:hypothetical protein
MIPASHTDAEWQNPTVDFPVMDDLAWINMLRELRSAKKGPLPGPDDDSPVELASEGDGGPNPGNCGGGCSLPCEYPGNYHNPLSQGPAEAGWGLAATEGGPYCSAMPTTNDGGDGSLDGGDGPMPVGPQGLH